MDDYELPDELDFHITGKPGLTVLQFDDEIKLHRQLICWCLIQRYWYNILSLPQVTDLEYDGIERLVKQMELECEYLSNKYSPSNRVSSSRREDYPYSVRSLFIEVDEHCFT